MMISLNDPQSQNQPLKLGWFLVSLVVCDSKLKIFNNVQHRVFEDFLLTFVDQHLKQFFQTTNQLTEKFFHPSDRLGKYKKRLEKAHSELFEIQAQ